MIGLKRIVLLIIISIFTGFILSGCAAFPAKLVEIIPPPEIFEDTVTSSSTGTVEFTWNWHNRDNESWQLYKLKVYIKYPYHDNYTYTYADVTQYPPASLTISGLTMQGIYNIKLTAILIDDRESEFSNTVSVEVYGSAN
ncbi:MAG: hypothetical protein ABIH39_01380 [Candidatus Margulisiibacteriota bacterium]